MAMLICQRFFVRLHRRGILLTFFVLCLIVVMKNTPHDSLVDRLFAVNEERSTTHDSHSSVPLKVDSHNLSIKQWSVSVLSAPFLADQPKLLVILAYQRTGSTFLGRLFRKNPEVFYMFEPLDSLYSSLYGTAMGWNVPSDITNDIHGTLRELPEREIGHVTSFLRSLLTCDVTALPTETLFHPYMIEFFSREFSVGSEYVPCVRKHRRSIRYCRSLVPFRYCGKRIWQKPYRIDECYHLMTNRSYRSQHTDRAQFYRYFNCTGAVRRVLDAQCVPHLQAACDRSPVRVVKLVRATMDSMARLLDALPNLRVLHLVRDPRAVALSRVRFHSSGRGLYSDADKNQTTLREASLYCQTAVRDLKVGSTVRGRYPGKIMTLVYDDVVRRFSEYARAVYEFLDLGVPVNISEALSTADNHTTTSADNWQSVLTYRTSKEIKRSCAEFFDAVPYDWSE